MFRKIARAIGLLFDPVAFRALGRMRYHGYLYQRGWFEALKADAAVQLNREPLPWMTYPFISFLEERLRTEMEMFEFGCGNSTLYFASKVHHIDSVEHDRSWFDKLSGRLPSNVNVIFEELQPDGIYSRTPTRTGKKYDLIVVDGRDRVHSIVNALPALKEHGVYVLDDAERAEYQEAVNFMRTKEFRSLPFWGIAPGMTDEKCTAIFYREDNCLGI